MTDLKNSKTAPEEDNEEYIAEKVLSYLKMFFAGIGLIYGFWTHNWVFIILTFVIIYDNYCKKEYINEIIKLKKSMP